MVSQTNQKQLVNDFQAAWQMDHCISCLDYFKQLRKRRAVEQYLFLKYDMNDMRKKKVVPKDWGFRWFNYLFFDTPIFDRISFTSNHGLPTPPDRFRGDIDSDGIVANAALWEVILRLYADKNKLEKSGFKQELLTQKDLHLIDAVVNQSYTESDLLEVEEKTKRLIEVRLQKTELEGCSENWFPSSAQELPGHEEEPDSGADPKSQFVKQTLPLDDEFEEDIKGTDQFPESKKTSFAQEFFDSDSEQENKEAIRKPLSVVEEERTEHQDEQTPSHSQERGLGPISPTNDRSLISNMIAGGRVNTAGIERNASDYITSESAIRNLVQKNLFLRDSDRLTRLGSFNLTDKRRDSADIDTNKTPTSRTPQSNGGAQYNESHFAKRSSKKDIIIKDICPDNSIDEADR